MSADNPYSTPLANDVNPNMVTARKSSGFVIAICVIFILFGIINLTVMPCSLAVIYFMPDMLENAVPANDNTQEAEQLREQMDQMKEMRTSPIVIGPAIASILLGLGQLVSSIAGFRRSQFGKTIIPIVAGFAILVTILNIVSTFLQPAPPNVEGAQDMSNMISLISAIVIGGGCAIFYGIVIAFSMSQSYRAHFGEPTSAVYK